MNKVRFPQSTMTSNGQIITLTWIKSDNLSEFKPVFQVYGIIFNQNGEILLQGNGKWNLPGGTPEGSENEMETLKRELIEEADVTVSKILPLGAQRVESPNNPNTNQGDLFYQLRYVCLVDELLPQTPDPDTGIVNQRMFVPAEKAVEYLKWGDTGKAIFKDAIDLFNIKLKPSM